MAKQKKEAFTEAELTAAEWAVMKVVWENEPCAAGTVQEALAKTKDWAYSTVKTTMDRMAAKGLLEITRIRNLQLFSAKITEADAQKSEFRKMLGRAFNGALTPMMEFLVENEEFSTEDLSQLRKLTENTQKKSK